MGKKYNAMNIVGWVLGVFAFAFLLVMGLKSVFGWDLNPILVSVAYLVGGLFLIGQSGFKISRVTSQLRSGKLKVYYHMLSAMFGVLFLYVGIINLPSVGSVLNIVNVARFTGWITLLGSLQALSEIWVK